ncbi:MAG: methionine synthase [Chloroflexi bacterium]|nr:methionine synthase [Chloroflexota bacterium]
MKRSTDRILTTHVGSLVRPAAILQGVKAHVLHEPYDEAQFARDVQDGIHEVVRKQAEIGIDIPSDGEYGRQGFRGYINERLGGLEPREPRPEEVPFANLRSPERELFPEFYNQYYSHYRYLWMPPEVDISKVPNLPGNHQHYRVVGPITYTGQAAIKHDIETLKSAMAGHHFADAFIASDVPSGRSGDENVRDFFASESAYLYAVADALHEEYKAITDSGLLLQIDLAALNPRRRWTLTESSNGIPDQETGQRAVQEGVEILNHALRDVPEDRVRYHHCWGSMNTPHVEDPPLREIAPSMLKIKAQAYVVEAANPRHEHEWMVWKDLKLPDGKILIPGLISHQTNVVEHPELVAWRIKNFVSLVGKENLIAGVDCGFSQYWDSIRVHPSVQWAKLKSLVDGAALASAELWRREPALAATC